MERLYINKGEKVQFQGKDCVIVKIISVNKVSIEECQTNIIHTVDVGYLEPYLEKKAQDVEIHNLSDKEWEVAQERFNTIKPILQNRNNLSIVKNISKTKCIGVSTIYRWLKIYDQTGLVSSLANKRRSGGVGKSRLLKVQEQIIQDKIHSVYLSKQRKSITKTIREINIACNYLSIKPPHDNTVRNRIKALSDEEKIRKRFGYQEAKYKFEPIIGEFPGADYPLAVVQIDHTPVDIILVDEKYRKPFKRPILTLAIDVFSRMVVGFYISFETPGFLGTGICIANSILPKEDYLRKIGVNTEWPCWGIMDTIHVDNAKEFRGKMMERACLNYNINIEFRPIGSPHYGGHVERLLGTFSKEIHDLPGTTFSSVEERKNYESEKNASFTLKEFEKWLTIYITKFYHQRVHSKLGVSPIEKYNQGVIGFKGKKGNGIPPRIKDAIKVRLDFLPSIERTVQEYGVIIDHITYYSDILRPYIHDSEKGLKKKHIFKRDPRDISVLYFYDPQRLRYYEIPYRDTTLPPISIWEYKEVIRKIKTSTSQHSIDEKVIFQAYRELNEIEDRAIRKTRKYKSRPIHDDVKSSVDRRNLKDSTDIVDNEEILPFEDIDDESFN